MGVFDPAGEPNHLVEASLLVSSLEDLENLEVDYCVVAAPTESHTEIGVRLATAGISILVEKPLAASSRESLILVDAVQAAGVVGGVGHIERFNAAIIELRRRVGTGDLGAIYQVATRRQGPFPDRIRDTGVVFDLATHDLHLASWITSAGYEEVFARTIHKAGRRHEDLVTISARLGGDIIANHLVNWLSPFKERTVIVIGDKGALVADTLTADLTFIENPLYSSDWETLGHFRGIGEGNMIRYALPKREPLLVEHEDFRNAVLAGGGVGVSLEEGLEVVRVAEAVLESAANGTVIRVAEPG